MEATTEAGSSAASPAQAGGGPQTKSLTEMEAIAVRQRRARYRDHCEKWGNALYDSALKVGRGSVLPRGGDARPR